MIKKSKFITSIIIFILISTVSAADINGRFVITNTNSSKLGVLVQINSNTGNDAIGGATIVFGFDTSAISLNNNPVKGTDYIFHNLCGNNYSPATITRPMKDRVWINVDLPFNQSNQGTVISGTPGWTDLVTIYFDITDDNGIADFYWMPASPFWGIYKDDNLTLLVPDQFQNNIYHYDITAPQLIGASLIDPNNLELEFSETLDSASAFNISNYSINKNINILGVSSSTNPHKIILNTTSHNPARQYTVSVSNISDPSGNLISGDYNSIEYIGSPSNTEEETAPAEFLLSQNYPNPFNPSTKISWQTPVGGMQTLKVYDVLGNEVATLVNDFVEAGHHEIEFKAADLASGVYVYQLQTEGFVETRKMIFLK